MKFQSAPRVLARGDAIGRIGSDGFQMFQSAPLVLARGDWCRLPARVSAFRFNPRPACWRGATFSFFLRGFVYCVSIRAPRVGAGRQSCKDKSVVSNTFQSETRVLARG